MNTHCSSRRPGSNFPHYMVAHNHLQLWFQHSLLGTRHSHGANTCMQAKHSWGLSRWLSRYAAVQAQCLRDKNRKLPGISWATSLAILMNSRYSERPCLKMYSGEQLRKTLDINFLLPRACTYICTCPSHRKAWRIRHKWYMPMIPISERVRQKDWFKFEVYLGHISRHYGTHT